MLLVLRDGSSEKRTVNEGLGFFVEFNADRPEDVAHSQLLFIAFFLVLDGHGLIPSSAGSTVSSA